VPDSYPCARGALRWAAGAAGGSRRSRRPRSHGCSARSTAPVSPAAAT